MNLLKARQLGLYAAAALWVGLGAGCPPAEPPDPCAEVTCDAPKTCDPVDATCKISCTADSHCGDTSLRCTSAGWCASKCEGVICGSGETCIADKGTCAPAGATLCASNADCAADATTKCDFVKGYCVDKCEGVTCDTTLGQTCDNTTGTCVGGATACNSDADCDATKAEACDTASKTCKAGQWGDCSGAPDDCAGGYDCFSLTDDQGKEMPTCLKKCTQGNECGITDTCMASTGTALDGYCFSNYCGPVAIALPGFQTADYLAPCDAAGTGDGACFGPVGQAGPADFGLCYGSGAAGQGGSCDLTAGHGDALACQQGFACMPTQPGSTSGLCLETCSAIDTKTCADFSLSGAVSKTACMAVYGPNGVCLPFFFLGKSPIAAGAECAPSTDGTPVCEDGYTCAADGAGATKCLATCDPKAGVCATGVCTVTTANPAVGYCK